MNVTPDTQRRPAKLPPHATVQLVELMEMAPRFGRLGLSLLARRLAPITLGCGSFGKWISGPVASSGATDHYPCELPCFEDVCVLQTRQLSSQSVCEQYWEKRCAHDLAAGRAVAGGHTPHRLGGPSAPMHQSIFASARSLYHVPCEAGRRPFRCRCVACAACVYVLRACMHSCTSIAQFSTSLPKSICKSCEFLDHSASMC
jgi:hypothetical protein